MVATVMSFPDVQWADDDRTAYTAIKTLVDNGSLEVQMRTDKTGVELRAFGIDAQLFLLKL